MKDFLKAVGFVLAVVTAMLLIGGYAGFGGRAIGLASDKAFAPREEAVRRETFEQSKAFQDGVISEIRNMQFEYLHADDAHKPLLADVIKHRAAELPYGSLPPDLHLFINQL